MRSMDSLRRQAEAAGFTLAQVFPTMKRPFQPAQDPREETLEVWWQPEGILLELDSFAQRGLNTWKISYQWRVFPRFWPDSGLVARHLWWGELKFWCFHQRSGGGIGWPPTYTYVHSYQSVGSGEPLAYGDVGTILAHMRLYGQFLNPWIGHYMHRRPWMLKIASDWKDPATGERLALRDSVLHGHSIEADRIAQLPALVRACIDPDGMFVARYAISQGVC